MYPDCEPTSPTTVSKIERKYRHLRHDVTDKPKQGRQNCGSLKYSRKPNFVDSRKSILYSSD